MEIETSPIPMVILPEMTPDWIKELIDTGSTEVRVSNRHLLRHLEFTDAQINVLEQRELYFQNIFPETFRYMINIRDYCATLPDYTLAHRSHLYSIGLLSKFLDGHR